MATNVNKMPSTGNGFKQPPIEPGGYPARVAQIIDYGFQPQPDYQGQAKDPKFEIGITYELVDEFCVDEEGNVLEDKPRWLSESFPLNPLRSDKAKSTQRYLALDPNVEKGGEFLDLITTPCTVTVVQNVGEGKNAGRVFNNVASVAPMRPKDAAKVPPLVNKPVVFSLDAPDLEVFNNLPDWIQNKIKANLNFQGSALQKLLGGKPDQEAAEGSAPEEGKTDW